MQCELYNRLFCMLTIHQVRSDGFQRYCRSQQTAACSRGLKLYVPLIGREEAPARVAGADCRSAQPAKVEMVGKPVNTPHTRRTASLFLEAPQRRSRQLRLRIQMVELAGADELAEMQQLTAKSLVINKGHFLGRRVFRLIRARKCSSLF